MKPCWFHPEALAEADHAAAFYKEQQPGLEVRFLEALNDAISRIRRNPLLYRCVDGEIRKCRIMRFPYGIIYNAPIQVVEFTNIVVLYRL
jgi:plasmid stabilization system protein ParE